MSVVTQIQIRRGTAASWTSANPTLAAGEFGFETDTNKLKCGNGSTAWSSLTYLNNDGDITGVTAGTGLSGGGTSGTVTLAIDTSVTVDKTTAQTLTNKTLTAPDLGTPTAITLTNGTGLPISGLTSSTTTALGVGSIELGNASDTTLSRASAGVVNIEGVPIVTTTASQTLTNKTLTSPVISSITNTGTLTLPTATGTVALTSDITVTASSTNTFTNKTFDTAGTGNSFSINSTAISAVTGTGSVVLATSPTIVTPVITQGQATPTFSANAYTLVAGDAGKLLLASNSTTAGTINIPTNASVAFATGTQITIINVGSGLITVSATTPATTTVLSVGATAASPKCRAQYSTMTIIKTATDTWYAMGDIA